MCVLYCAWNRDVQTPVKTVINPSGTSAAGPSDHWPGLQLSFTVVATEVGWAASDCPANLQEGEKDSGYSQRTGEPRRWPWNNLISFSPRDRNTENKT